MFISFYEKYFDFGNVTFYTFISCYWNIIDYISLCSRKYYRAIGILISGLICLPLFGNNTLPTEEANTLASLVSPDLILITD
ncbi:MAG: hypothetical protein R3321_12610 [Nitrososphaeraceae archaeon]|nr:hypothetical protein [Nitrososphaeraceae archaeon]